VVDASPDEEFAAFQARIAADARVLGAVLSGSQARPGAATRYSDYDVILVAADDDVDDLAGEARHDAQLDVSIAPLTKFRTEALPGSGSEWNRYAFVHARVLKDTDAGLIAELIDAKTTLTEPEVARSWYDRLGGFLNSAYRALKNERDGNAISAQLDAADALSLYLHYVFVLNGRVKPFNKYLSWELTHYPLPQPELAHDHLLRLLAEALSPTPGRALRQLLTELEPVARTAGHGMAFDEWDDELAFLRADPHHPA